MNVGVKIKTLRKTQQMSLENLAENAGLTMEEMDLMENSDTIPSLAQLIKVARALGVRLGTFLDDNTNLGPVVNKLDDNNKTKSFSSKASQDNSSLDFYALANKKSGRHMEPFLIDVNPSENISKPLSSHEGEEFIYVLTGSIEIKYGKENYILNAGESIYYDSIIDHLVTATNEGAKILAVVYSPM